jgi:PKHD-type hydroxylase
MSVYLLAPSPSIAVQEPAFATWSGLFTNEQIDRLCAYGDAQALAAATVGNDTINPDVRVSETAWLSLNDETQPIYDSLAWCARQINGQFYDLDLFGFVEDLQYTVYRGEGAHYDWHIDKGANTLAPRKLSLVVQLSDPDEYEGGDLQIFADSTPETVAKQKGFVAAFPSYTLHRVTPVTSGIRRSLVVWLSGPRLR